MIGRRLLTIALVVAAGCVTRVPPTEVVVVIDADPSIHTDVEQLHVRVLGGSRGSALTSQADQVVGAGSSLIEWPVRVALAPAMGDADRLFEVEVDALDGANATIGVVRARSSYVVNRTLELRLTLEECCRAVAPTCTADQTCRDCSCVSADVAVATLPDFTETDATVTVTDGGSPSGFAARNLPMTTWSSATGAIVVTSSATIDTDSGVVLIDGHASRDFTPIDIAAVGDCRGVLAIATGTFTVAAGATVSVTGSRGLAIAATGVITIDGTIDVGAHGAAAGPGGIARRGGGGYGTEGGLDGACGGSGVIPTFGDALMTGLCGGTSSDAAGSGGAGGALELASQVSVVVSASGVVRAVGGGGASGAGGSGGAVLLQAPIVRVAGVVSVNGGAGGGGAGPGEDGHTSTVAATSTAGTCAGSCSCGGSPCMSSGGAGAYEQSGAAPGVHGSSCAFCSGGDSCLAGGGGGGGAGRIRIDADMRDYIAGRVLEYPGAAGAFSDGPL